MENNPEDGDQEPQQAFGINPIIPLAQQVPQQADNGNFAGFINNPFFFNDAEIQELANFLGVNDIDQVPEAEGPLDDDLGEVFDPLPPELAFHNPPPQQPAFHNPPPQQPAFQHPRPPAINNPPQENVILLQLQQETALIRQMLQDLLPQLQMDNVALWQSLQEQSNLLIQLQNRLNHLWQSLQEQSDMLIQLQNRLIKIDQDIQMDSAVIWQLLQDQGNIQNDMIQNRQDIQILQKGVEILQNNDQVLLDQPNNAPPGLKGFGVVYFAELHITGVDEEMETLLREFQRNAGVDDHEISWYSLMKLSDVGFWRS